MKLKLLLCVAFVAIAVILSSLFKDEPVWIDVRSVAEHQVDAIEGDQLIPHTKIVKEVTKKYPDKNTELHLYCRSGNRAGQALTALKRVGYSNVHNAGSIADARKTRGLTQ